MIPRVSQNTLWRAPSGRQTALDETMRCRSGRYDDEDAARHYGTGAQGRPTAATPERRSVGHEARGMLDCTAVDPGALTSRHARDAMAAAGRTEVRLRRRQIAMERAANPSRKKNGPAREVRGPAREHGR